MRQLEMRFRRTFFILVFSSIVFLTFILYFIEFSSIDARLCFITPTIEGDNDNDNDDKHTQKTTSKTVAGTGRPRLLEDVLAAEPKPIPGKSIFFHDTSCRWLRKSQESWGFFGGDHKPHFNIADLTARQACAIESAALHHPNLTVFVLFASPSYSWQENTNSRRSNKSGNSILDALLSYQNIYLRNLNLWTYAANTPLQDFLENGKLFESKYVLSHVSDFLRYLTLWRFGGTYLDMDVIVQRNLEDLLPNFTGAESMEDLAAGVMGFMADSYGHQIAEACLMDFKNNFKGYDWGNNGPGVVTRTFKKLCKVHKVKEMLEPGRCKHFHVYQPEAFYAVPWRQWKLFFDEKYSTEALKQTENSFVIHVWNKHSSKWHLSRDSKSAYALLARKHCPKVYASLTDYF